MTAEHIPVMTAGAFIIGTMFGMVIAAYVEWRRRGR